MTKVCIALTAALLVSTAATVASAQETRTLKLAGVVPPTHYMAETADKFFMEKVKELTDGKIDFEYYPAQQLGKANAIMDLTKSGVTDIGHQPSGYVLDRLPLSGVAGLPGIAETACAATRAMSKMAQPGGLLYEDYEANGVRPIFNVALPQYKVILGSDKIDEVSDFAGLKLRTDGGVMEMTASALDAVSVQLASPDVYQSLSRGTIDGVFFALLSAKPYKLETVAKHATLGYGFGTASVNWMISTRVWDSLEPDVQEALQKAGRLAEENFCAYVDQNEDAEAKALEKAGVTITTLSDEQRAALDEKLADVAEQWAADLEARGKPGKAVLEQFRQEAAAGG